MNNNDDFLMSLLEEEEILNSHCTICNKKKDENEEFDKCFTCYQPTCFNCIQSRYAPQIDDFVKNCASCYAYKSWQKYHFCIDCKALYFTPKYTKSYEKKIECNTKRCNECNNELWKYVRLLWIGTLKNSDNNECHFSKLPNEIIKYIINNI
jgi:hypothetical protein